MTGPTLEPIQSAMLETDVERGALLLLAIFITTGLVLAKKNPFILVARFFKLIFSPLIRLLKFLRIIKRSAAGVPSVGPNPWAVLARPFSTETATESMLRDIQESKNRNVIRNNGLYFCWLRPGDGCVPEQDEDYTQENAEEDLDKAKRFLNYDIPVTQALRSREHQFLYEDIEGAMISDLFRDSDRVCFYVLTEMRKVINSNIRKLAVSYSLIVFIVFIANIFLSGGISFTTMFQIEPVTVGQVTFNELFINKAIFGVVSFLLGVIIMWMLYSMEYKHYQRNNGRELNSYITRYLANLNSHYRQADAEARGAILKQEGSSSAMGDHAQLWFINLQWIGFRFFFIEWFLRNVFYQITRNSSYYLAFVPLGFAVVIALLAILFDIQELNLLNTDAAIYKQNTFYILFPLLFLLYYRYLSRALEFIQDAIQEREWIEFHNLRLDNTTRNIILRYIDEVKIWRERFRGSDSMGN